MTSRSESSIRSVSARTASTSTSDRAARSSHAIGGPTSTRARERNLSLVGSTIPMGTIGATVPVCAAVPSAMRAAPVRRVASEGSE